MTKINKKREEKNVRSYIPDKVKLFLDEYLPCTYTEEALVILRKRGITTTSGVVRNVKAGISKNNKILNVLVKMANENKKIEEKIRIVIDKQ